MPTPMEDRTGLIGRATRTPKDAFAPPKPPESMAPARTAPPVAAAPQVAAPTPAPTAPAAQPPGMPPPGVAPGPAQPMPSGQETGRGAVLPIKRIPSEALAGINTVLTTKEGASTAIPQQATGAKPGLVNSIGG